VNDAVLKVVKESFKETSAVRFEGNNYSNEWVDEAHKRGLLNLRRTPEALAQLTTKNSRTVLTKLGILTKAEIDSRYHVKMERYVKDMLIELHTMGQIVDTMILPGVLLLSRHAGRRGIEGEDCRYHVDSADRRGERDR
jgi:glutamine synthetase